MAGRSTAGTTGPSVVAVPRQGPSNRRAAPVETSVAGHRRGGALRPSRLRSVRVQLLAPILVALIGLGVLGGVQTRTARAAADDAERAQILAKSATSTARLVHEVEREIAETTALRQRGGKSGLGLVTAQRTRVDSAIARYAADSRNARKAAPSVASVLDFAEQTLKELNNARDDSLAPTPAPARSDLSYKRVVNALLAVGDALPAQVQDPRLANAARAVAAVAAIEHFDALIRDLLRSVFVRGKLDPGELTSLANLTGSRDQRLFEFQRVASTEDRDRFSAVFRGQDVEASTRIVVGALAAERDPSGVKVDPDAWYAAQSNQIRRVNLIGLQLSDRLDRLAAQLARRAQQQALITIGGTALLGALAFLTALVLAVRTSRRLRRLRAAALTVARRELPDAIASITTGGNSGLSDKGPSAFATTRAIAATNDEIGQVAESFTTVHRTALRLAGEQAELRVDVARMAEVLARRIRTLITRQLRLLDEFERDETDPDALARLFALDHIAARLRRNGENLLVLAGGEPGRPVTGAFPLRNVITAAASEIEDFHRVEASVTDMAIAGPAVGDLVHLLAELLENAASFSPPEYPVRVDARRTVDGAVIRVHDGGIGIAPNRLAEINSRLARPAMLSSAAAGTMGLYVVAHLAARHGVRVQLHATGTGTVAYVVLPHSVLAVPSAITAGAVAADPEKVVTGSMGRTPAMAGAPALAGAGVGGRLEQLSRAGFGNQAATAPGASGDAWFRPFLRGASTNGNGQVGPARPGSAPSAWGPSVAAMPRPPAEFINTERGLPKRAPGAQLAPEVGVSAAQPAGSTAQPGGQPGQPPQQTGQAPVDPEIVRARLSAFAEGVSAALRRSNSATPAAKDR